MFDECVLERLCHGSLADQKSQCCWKHKWWWRRFCGRVDGGSYSLYYYDFVPERAFSNGFVRSVSITSKAVIGKLIVIQTVTSWPGYVWCYKQLRRRRALYAMAGESCELVELRVQLCQYRPRRTYYQQDWNQVVMLYCGCYHASTRICVLCKR